MGEHYGIILLDGFELLLRVYVTNGDQWKLMHYHQHNFAQTENPSIPLNDNVSLVIAEIFSSSHVQHIAEWFICARKTDSIIIRQIQQIISCEVENLTVPREQELISKGMFTELW